MTKIEIDLNELIGGGRDPETGEMLPGNLQDVIVERAVNQIAGALQESARGEMVMRALEAVVNDEVRATVQKALSEPIQRRSQWGERKGEPTTVLEIVREKLEEFLQQPAARRDSYSGRREGPLNLADMITETVSTAMSKELRDTVIEARKSVTARVEAMLAEQLPKALAK